MTETHRSALLTACSYAKVFLAAADHELRGGPSEHRIEAQMQLAAALLNLSPPALLPSLEDVTR